MEETWDIRMDSYQRNPSPFAIDENIRDPVRYIDAMRFDAIVEGPERVQVASRQHGKALWYSLRAWYDQWTHASLMKMEYKLGVVCDMRYTCAADEIAWLERFHSHMHGLTSMETIYSHVRQVKCPFVEKD